MIGHMVLGMLYKKLAMVIVDIMASQLLALELLANGWRKVPVQAREKTFFELMFLLSTFEKRLGLQQLQRDSGADGEVLIQLGSRLKCSLKFHT